MAKKNSDDILSNDNLAFKNEDKKHEFTEKASADGEEALSGDAADLETDDDMLENAHDMGLYKGDDGAHPQELNLAGEVQKAEDNRRGI